MSANRLLSYNLPAGAASCAISVGPSFGSVSGCPDVPWLSLQWSCEIYSPTTQTPTKTPKGDGAFIVPLVTTLSSILVLVLAWLLWRRLGAPPACKRLANRRHIG